LGRRPLGAVLHSSNEPGELSQWLCHDESTINIVLDIIIIIIIIKIAERRTIIHSDTVIGTLAVDGWAVTFGTVRRGLGRLWFCPVPSSLTVAVPNVTADPSMATWGTIIAFAL